MRGGHSRPKGWSMEAREYAVGQRIVHPKYGLGIIHRIESETLLGQKSRCLKIHFPQNNTKILIPVEHADDLNMRSPMTSNASSWADLARLTESIRM